MLDLSWNQFGRAPAAMTEFVKKLPAGSLRALKTLRLGGCFLGDREQTCALLGVIEFARKATGALTALEEIVGISPRAVAHASADESASNDDDNNDEIGVQGDGEGGPEDSFADLVEGVRLVRSAESSVSRTLASLVTRNAHIDM